MLFEEMNHERSGAKAEVVDSVGLVWCESNQA